MILKLECLFYQDTYILFHLIIYWSSHSHTQTNAKKPLIEKKTHQILIFFSKFSQKLKSAGPNQGKLNLRKFTFDYLN